MKTIENKAFEGICIKDLTISIISNILNFILPWAGRILDNWEVYL